MNVTNYVCTRDSQFTHNRWHEQNFFYDFYGHETIMNKIHNTTNI
jgi:hypothetical protein